jgi:hypothetical protein
MAPRSRQAHRSDPFEGVKNVETARHKLVLLSSAGFPALSALRLLSDRTNQALLSFHHVQARRSPNPDGREGYVVSLMDASDWHHLADESAVGQRRFKWAFDP